MKIKFKEYDLDSDFVVREVDFCGENCYLIFPQHIGCKWTKDNLIFRSSIWSKKGELLSAGFRKFANLGENPDVFPIPENTNRVNILNKIDGSLAIVDYYNSKLNIRSRGTAKIDDLDNSDDWYACLKKYPYIESWLKEHDNVTLLFEITTPNLKIVLNYGDEPDFTLIGAVDKRDYSMFSQKALDGLSEIIKVKRPTYYKFDSVDEIIQYCESNKDIEGFCVYFGNDQRITKVKTDWYKKLHRMKSELGSYERVVDFYFENDNPSYNEMYKIICDTLDYEIAEEVKPSLSRICDGMKEVHKIVDNMKDYVENNKHKSRKEFAIEVKQKWGDTNRAGFLFTLLDGKSLKSDNFKKLLYQVTKK